MVCDSIYLCHMSQHNSHTAYFDKSSLSGSHSQTDGFEIADYNKEPSDSSEPRVSSVQQEQVGHLYCKSKWIALWAKNTAMAQPAMYACA
jgi:hypothetical protein